METKKIVLENSQEIEVKKSVADKWSKKSPERYLLNYGGKIALMQLVDINATLPQEEKLYSFSDCVAYMVKLHNIVHKDSVVFMDNLVNAEKSSYERTPTPVVAKTDDTIVGLKKFCDDNKVKSVAVLTYLLENRTQPNSNKKMFDDKTIKAYAKLFEDNKVFILNIPTPPQQNGLQPLI